MAKYMTLGSYTNEGLKGLLKEGGSGRRKAVQDAVQAMGGSLEAYYFAFGDFDVVAISEVPDNITAAALAIGISATGTGDVETVVLITPEEVDAATKKTLSFRAAGQERLGSDRWLTFGCFWTLFDLRHGIPTTGELLFAGRGPEFLDGYIALEAEVEEGPFKRYRAVLTETTRRAAKQMGADLKPDDATALVSTIPHWPPFDDVGAALAEVRREGWKLALLTN